MLSVVCVGKQMGSIMGATLLSTMRDEAPFILEWVSYHKAIGFDRIVVFSNDCTDGTDRILDALDAAGEVVHVRHNPPADLPIAAEISRLVLKWGLIPNEDWAIWLDADEFLNIHVGDGRVEDLAAVVGNARGMCISWRIFGDSGQSFFRGAFLAEPFTGCAAPGQAWQNVKTFFRFGPDISELFQHKPILTPEFWLEDGRFLSSSGVEMHRNSDLMRKWVKGRKRGKILESEAGWNVAQINHYAVRTNRLFEYKKARGRIGEANKGGEQRYSDGYFRGLNLNSAEDKSILRWSDIAADGSKALAKRIQPELDVAVVIAENYSSDVVQIKIEDSSVYELPTIPKNDAASHRYKRMHKAHHDEIDERKYSNALLAKAITGIIGPREVIDVGCGIGLLLSYLADSGAEVTGVEGQWLEEEAMVLEASRYLHVDLEHPFKLERRFDLCCSIEVAEHLEPDRADSFVHDLCALSDAVVFSAAIGGQGGRGHKNEQWQEYWCDKFEARGYGTYDPFRQALRRDPKVLPWFQQNVLLFLRNGHPLTEKLANAKITPALANMILPIYHQKILNRTRRGYRKKIAAMS